MKPLKKLTADLAFKVDRKVLELEEEDFYRIDVPEAGVMDLSSFFQSVQTSPNTYRQFVITALCIFLLLFTVTNMQSYSKILSANITQIFRSEVQEAAPAFIQEQHELSLSSIQAEDGILPIPVLPTTYEDRLIIPKIGVNAPIVLSEKGLNALKGQDWTTLEREIQDGLKRGIVHYPGTAEPGEKGNVFLTGHSSNVFWEKSEYNSVFALLPRLDVGDDIYLFSDQERFHYRITEKKEVSPKDISVLEQGDGKELSLMTCTPVGTRLKRLIVKAELIQS